jgi:hypothetical protein
VCLVYSFQDACISYMILVEKSVGFDTVFSCKCTEDEKGAYVIFDGIACGSKRLLVRNCRCDLRACCMAYRITERLNAECTVPHHLVQSHVHEPWAPGADKVGQPGTRHEDRVYLPRSAGTTLKDLLKAPIAVAEYKAMLATLEKEKLLELIVYLVRLGLAHGCPAGVHSRLKLTYCSPWASVTELCTCRRARARRRAPSWRARYPVL